MGSSEALSALVVDDDEFVRNLLLRQLSALGVKSLSCATEGDGARRALREQGPFQLIVCDLVMPGVDGIELLRDIAVLHPHAGVVLASSMDTRMLRSVEELA